LQPAWEHGREGANQFFGSTLKMAVFAPMPSARRATAVNQAFSSSEAQILPQGPDKRFPASRTDDFLRNFEASSLQTHRSKRILAAHSLLHLFFCCHLQEVP
jgi:hypothetical protein